MSDRVDGATGLVRRGFYVGLGALMTFFAVSGFWITYWGPLFS